MNNSLKHTIISAVLWQGLSYVGNNGISFVISVILARLLEPNVFGIVAITSSSIAFLAGFLDIGFSSAIIQKKEIDNRDCSSVFYLNIIFAFTLFFVLFWLSPHIAEYYDRKELSCCIRVLALIIPIRSLSMVQGTLIYKKMQFALSFKITMISVCISGIIGISLAFLGFEYWALIIQQLISSSITGILQWYGGKWLPELRFDFLRIKKLFNYGGKLFLSGLLENVQNNFYPMAIGKMFNLTTLSFYNRGRNLAQAATGCIYGAIGATFFPILSDIQDDNMKLKKVLQRSQQNVMFLVIPAMSFLVVTAHPLIYLVYGEKWLSSAPFLQCFALNSIFFPLSSLNLQLLMAKGRSDAFLILEIIKKVLFVLTLFLFYRYGILAVVYGQVGLGISSFFLNSYMSSKLIGYSSIAQIKDIFVYFLMAGVSTALSGSAKFFHLVPLAEFSILACIFGISYLGMAILFNQIPKEIIGFSQEKFPFLKLLGKAGIK